MKNQFRITMIGSGNVAWHLGPALENGGHIVEQVYSRDPQHAQALVKRLYDSTVARSLDFSESDSKIFIIAVSDKAIESISTEIVLPPHSVLVHTSGTEPMEILNYAASESVGVFYPLQTFSKSRKVSFENVPICIEADNKPAENILKYMADSISNEVYYARSEDRRILHLGAVFANNFMNHLMVIAKDIMESKNLNFDILKPLIAETVNKSLEIDPAEAQTGPARRGDLQVLNKHLEILQDNRMYADIYKMLSQSIMDKYL